MANFILNNFRSSTLIRLRTSLKPRNYSSSSESTRISNQNDVPKRMKIQFKCLAPAPSNLDSSNISCGHLNSHEFSSHSFHRGIVLVQCPSCLNRHLIADNLQWFTSNPTSDDPNFKNDYKNIIEIMKAKGETVKRAKLIQHHSNDHSSSDTNQKLIHENDHVIEYYQ